MTFKDIYSTKSLVEFYEKEYTGSLDESGAGIKRVLKTIQDKNFLLISGFRQNNSTKENIQRNNKMIQEIREELGTEKSGAYKLVGHWKECSVPLGDGETIKDCSKKGGSIQNALEESWLIPSDESPETLKKIGSKYAKKYDQDGFIVGDDKGVHLYGKDGSKWETWNKITQDTLSKGFSKVVGQQGYTELKKDRVHGRVQNLVFEEFEDFKMYLSIPKDNNSSKMVFKYQDILF